MEHRLTINDISETLKLSKTTISLVLNGHGEKYRISKSVRERILAFVAESGYTPSANAKSMRTHISQIISLLIDDIKDPAAAELAYHVERAAFAKQYKVIYHSTNSEVDKINEIMRQFGDNHCDGSIITVTRNIDDAYLLSLHANKFPCVLFYKDPAVNTPLKANIPWVQASGSLEKDAISLVDVLLLSIGQRQQTMTLRLTKHAILA